MPAASALCAFAFTTSSVSAWYCRRSLCPTTTYEQPSLASMPAEISPVYAPESCSETSWAPYLIDSRSPSTSVCTDRRSVNGGSTTTSARE